MPFVKGQSGNPAGRALGLRNRASLLMEAKLEGEAEALADRLVQRAMAGEASAMRLCVQNLLPRRRERSVAMPLPPIRTGEDVRLAAAEIAEGVGVGAISPREAIDLLRVVEKLAQALAAAEAME